MTDVQFEDSARELGSLPPASEKGQAGLTGKLVAWGLASGQKQAQTIMVGTIVAVWVVIGLIFFFLWL